MARFAAYGIGMGLVALVALPAFDHPTEDSYPLSTYPMFARPRPRPRLFFAEGLDAEGTRHRLPPRLVATEEVMQAAATVRRAVQGGPAAMGRLCASIADRAAQSAEHASLIEIALVDARFDPVAYFTRGPEPVERRVVHQCAVGADAKSRPRRGRRGAP
ncbi:MAG TPA: hypothetical protein VKY73_22970 [Polyangiaceae bacterium]|nr:hypothetical protein [Polyangiaceae bacterium]